MLCPHCGIDARLARDSSDRLQWLCRNPQCPHYERVLTIQGQERGKEVRA